MKMSRNEIVAESNGEDSSQSSEIESDARSQIPLVPDAPVDPDAEQPLQGPPVLIEEYYKLDWLEIKDRVRSIFSEMI